MRDAVIIERMAYGPHAIAHQEGRVLFIRSVAPGERVRVTVQENHDTYAFAEVNEVLEPAPSRRVPPCPYLPRCGGCPWQHLRYEAQLEAKVENVRDHLQRIGKIDNPPFDPPVPASEEFGYRNRLSLRVEGGLVGFYAGASHDLVRIERCLLANDTVNAAVEAVANLIALLRSQVRRAEIVADAVEPQVAIALEVQGPWAAGDSDAVGTWLTQHGSIRGCIARGKRWRRQWGDPRVTVEPEPGLQLLVHAGTFTQVNPSGNRSLVATVLEYLQPTATDQVIDAYAGAGNFTFPLARRCQFVLAIESDPLAINDLEANVKHLQVGNVHPRRGFAERVLKRLAGKGTRIDAVVLDPPRSGGWDAVAPILELKPARIVYVSCNSATLARDLAGLARNYRVERVRVIDLFPQTYHVETVVRLVLT